MKKNPPLLSTMLIIGFEGICGTFGEGKKNHCHQQHWVSLPRGRKKKKNLFLSFLKQRPWGGC
jgi:hypothetical protein